MKQLLPIMLVLFYASCQTTRNDTPASSVESNVNEKRPLALDSGKFFDLDGRRMLYGGDDPAQHFDVTNNELNDGQFHYGIGREFFPALIEPEFTTVEEVDSLWKDSDRFLIAYKDDDVKAYSVKDLTRHEVVNDQLGGTPIMAAYCVLADLGGIYERNYGGEELTFALSGYTYYDSLVWDGLDGFVFWDRETESLWWPLIGKAFSGPLRGTKLLEMDKVNWADITWKEVKSKYPTAKILKSGQDFERPNHWDQTVDASYILENFSE